MKLTEIKIRNAKPKENSYKISDGRGMYLEISPRGGKWWRLKYRIYGKEKRISLGTYPDTSLKLAREKCDEARKLLAAGIDPSQNRKATKAAYHNKGTHFELIAREWHSKYSDSWTEAHAKKILRNFSHDIFPYMGGEPIESITAPQLLQILRRVEERPAIETAHRLLLNCGKVFRYAIATGRVQRDIAADLKGALQPLKQVHRAAITDTKKAGELLRAIDGYQGSFVTQCALKLAPLTFVRPGELRHAEWSEIDLENSEWNIPASKMKMKDPHLVPLAIQAITILKEIKLLTGSGRYVFPSARSRLRPMSNNAILAALRRMGYEKHEMSGHGFRAMARTILDETLGIRPDFIEHQLAHAVRDPNGRAYNRTAHLTERKKMMQTWADYLDKLKTERI